MAKLPRTKPIALSSWIERSITLPDVCAEPGPIKLAPYAREIADGMGDPSIERITVLKSARIGFSTLLTSAIGFHAVCDPCSILVLLPSESDCRVVSDVERLFDSSKALRERLSGPKARRDMSTNRP